MAYRGGRGGFGRGAGGGRFAKQEKFEVFPEIKEYPDINFEQIDEYKELVSCGHKLNRFWNLSPYHLGDLDQDSEKNEGKTKIPLSEYMMMTDEYVPAELAAKNVRRSNKKVRWDLQSDLQRLDMFERLDQGPKGQDDGEKEKKEDEEEDDDNENVEDEEDDSGDDYDQNPDFDDDEDDFNMNEDLGGDEGCY